MISIKWPAGWTSRSFPGVNDGACFCGDGRELANDHPSSKQAGMRSKQSSAGQANEDATRDQREPPGSWQDGSLMVPSLGKVRYLEQLPFAVSGRVRLASKKCPPCWVSGPSLQPPIVPLRCFELPIRISAGCCTLSLIGLRDTSPPQSGGFYGH